MTELAPVVLIEPFSNTKAGSAGVVIPNTQMKIASDWCALVI